MNVSADGTATAPLSKELVCSLPTNLENYFYSAFLILILIVTFIGNLLVILAVVFTKHLRSVTNYIIVSLAVSDLLISLLSLPFKVDQTVHNFQWCLGLTACRVVIVIDALCSFASIWNLVIIAIDRYIAIVHPVRYHSLITTKVGYGMISFVWGFSTFLAMMALLNWSNPGQEHIFHENECQLRLGIYFTVTAAVAFFLPLIIITVMYSLVFRVALNQARSLTSQQVDSRRQAELKQSSMSLVREVKAAKTLSLVIGCFIVCWLPFNVIMLIGVWNQELLQAIPEQSFLGLNIAFAYVLPSLNSTMNPIIYAFFMRDYRDAFRRLIRRLTGRRSEADGLNEGTAASVVDSTITLHTLEISQSPIDTRNIYK